MFAYSTLIRLMQTSTCDRHTPRTRQHLQTLRTPSHHRCLSALVSRSATCCSLLSRRTTSLFDLTSSCRHKCDVNECASCGQFHTCGIFQWAVASTTSTSFTTNRKSHTIPFESDPPTGAGDNLASAQLLAVSNIVPAFEDLRVSSQPAQSESGWTFTSQLTVTEDLFPLPFTFQIPVKLLQSSPSFVVWDLTSADIMYAQ